ncbi:pre T-cell antigen receptor alpha isoform 3-T5 [Spheniscus humboldti]
MPGDGRRSWWRQLGAEPSAAARSAAAMEVPWVLLAAALLPLLPPTRAAGPLPTLAPPLSMVVAGQRRRLVVCVVSDLAPGSGHTVWISGGNGSALQSFAYGASREDGGTVCTVSLLPDDPPAEGDLACHVGPNRTSPAHSSSPIHITGNEGAAEPCPGSTAVPPARASAALLMAVRVVLLKVALSDALLTSILLAQS